MVKQCVSTTTNVDIDSAIEDLCLQLGPDRTQSNLAIFMASSSYDFFELSEKIKKKFPSTEVIGVSTSGEISQLGFTKNSIVLTTLSCDYTTVSGTLIENSEGLAILSKSDIQSSFRESGFVVGNKNSANNGFGFMFVTGLKNIEETMLSLIYGVIQVPDFKFIGGSAGDDLKMKETFVCYNGKVTSNGAAVVFVKTSHTFDIRRENIFKPSGETMILTKVDIPQRKLLEINGEPAMEGYARTMGVSVEEAKQLAFSHPIGRIISDDVYTSSIQSCNEDNTINVYSRLLPGMKVHILKEADIYEIQAKTVEAIEKVVPKPKFVFLVNCILRTVGFEQGNHCAKLTDKFNEAFGSFCGFSSYGEQINKINSNQTLVSLVIGE